jgi:hypothetical protein
MWARNDTAGSLAGEAHASPSQEEHRADAVAAALTRDTSATAVEPEGRATLRAQTGVAPSAWGPGRPLEPAARELFEPRLNVSLEHVRIHEGGSAAASAQALGARAFAWGSHVVFGPGQYAPGSGAGRRLLAHELAHVAGDRGGAPELRMDRRRPSDPPLPIQVPESDTVDRALLNPQGHRYPWQNPALLAATYPKRAEALRNFLIIERQRDLEQGPAPTASLTDVAAAREERTRLQTEARTQRRATRDREERQRLDARIAELGEDLAAIPTLPRRGGELSRSAAARFQLWQYRQELAGLGTDALLRRVLDRFDADPSGARYSRSLRYMVIHYSGMVYQSAHGSYAPAQELLVALRGEQLRGEVAELPGTEVEDEAARLRTSLLPEETTGSRRERQQVERLRADLNAPARVLERVFTRRGEESRRSDFLEWTRLDRRRRELELELGRRGELRSVAPSAPSPLDVLGMCSPDDAETMRSELEFLYTRLAQLEQSIGRPAFQQARQRLESAQGTQRAAVLAARLRASDRQMRGLEEEEALRLLVATREQQESEGHPIPSWAWRTIRGHTALRYLDPDIQQGSGVSVDESVTLTPEEQQQRQAQDPETRRWRAILQAWTRRDVTQWRARHAQDLGLVMWSAVCNEVGESLQHARGLELPGGISANAAMYGRQQALDPSWRLLRPTRADELRVGASLFWLEWTTFTGDRRPAGHDAARPRTLGDLLVREDGHTPMRDGDHDAEQGWTYHVDGINLYRSRVPGAPSQTSDLTTAGAEVQWLRFFHQATITHPQGPASTVVTFETGPIGARTRPYNRVLGQWNVLLGYGPDTREHSRVDEYLRDIFPGRSALPTAPAGATSSSGSP